MTRDKTDTMLCVFRVLESGCTVGNGIAGGMNEGAESPINGVELNPGPARHLNEELMLKECSVHVQDAGAECDRIEARRQRHVEREDRACERMAHLAVRERLADAGVRT